MTLEELLKSFEIPDKQIKKIMDAAKENKIFTASEENLDLRYEKLKGEHDSKSKELDEAVKLIDELKKSSKGNDEMQGKIQSYESELENLRKENEQLRIDADVRFALLAEGAASDDIDYLIYKIKEKGEISLDDDQKIKGLSDSIAALKTKFPKHFRAEEGKKIEEHKLPEGGADPKPEEPKNLADALKQKYGKEDE